MNSYLITYLDGFDGPPVIEADDYDLTDGHVANFYRGGMKTSSVSGVSAVGYAKLSPEQVLMLYRNWKESLVRKLKK